MRRTVEGAILLHHGRVAGRTPSTTAHAVVPLPVPGRIYRFLAATKRIASPPPGASAIVSVSPFFTCRCSIVIE